MFSLLSGKMAKASERERERKRKWKRIVLHTENSAYVNVHNTHISRNLLRFGTSFHFHFHSIKIKSNKQAINKIITIFPHSLLLHASYLNSCGECFFSFFSIGIICHPTKSGLSTKFYIILPFTLFCSRNTYKKQLSEIAQSTHWNNEKIKSKTSIYLRHTQN